MGDANSSPQATIVGDSLSKALTAKIALRPTMEGLMFIWTSSVIQKLACCWAIASGAAGTNRLYYSKGDLRVIREIVTTAHGDQMPRGLYVPFETAWKAVKEFVEMDGRLPI